MRLRLERVLFDGNGKEISRKPIGEYSTELDAIVAMQAEDQKSREAGEKNSRIDMVQILKSPKERRLGC